MSALGETGPPERKDPAWSAIQPGHYRTLATGVDCLATYDETESLSTAAQRIHDFNSVGFWLKPDAFQFHRRWESQPLDQPKKFVCFGELPGRGKDHFVWVWHPSGYLREIGEAQMRSGREMAAAVARLIPGSQVLDCRAEYAA